MDAGVYETESKVEGSHWWFVGRRKLFARLISGLGLSPRDPILDVGTSTGTNLRMLRQLGFENFKGLDLSEDAIHFCATKGFDMVHQGDITAIPFEDGAFDLVLATDIVEHVDDDAGALSELCRVLHPKGTLLLTVPAFPSLWGFQDEVSHHQRRYRMKGLLEILRANGLEPYESFHFNYLLFAPIWTARQLMKVLKPSIKSENDINSPLLNRSLSAIFDFDIMTAEKLRPSFGVSILVLARKTAVDPL